jgi:hypothetical protein
VERAALKIELEEPLGQLLCIGARAQARLRAESAGEDICGQIAHRRLWRQADGRRLPRRSNHGSSPEWAASTGLPPSDLLYWARQNPLRQRKSSSELLQSTMGAITAISQWRPEQPLSYVVVRKTRHPALSMSWCRWASSKSRCPDPSIIGRIGKRQNGD